MAYEEKTDWLPDDPINEDDVNRWEKGIKDAHTDLAAHKNDMNNPHNTTKAQVGLGNVDNVQQASKTEFNSHMNDTTRHITSAERSNWNAKETPAGSQSKADTAERNAKAYTDELAARRDNPNQVTKAQVGLGNVDNVLQASKAEFSSHTNDTTCHITSDERTKWNNSQLFKITADNGTQKINLTSGTFYEALKDLGSVSFYGTNAVTDNPSSGSLRGMQLVGQPGIGIGYAVDVSGNAWWFYYNANHTKVNWYPIETITGAQSKVNDHAKNQTLHISSMERTKWNSGQLYPLTTDKGQRIQIKNGGSLFDLPTGFYFGAAVQNLPGDDKAAWYYYDITEVSAELAPPQGLKKIVATRSFDNQTWIGIIHKEGDFLGWKRLITDGDFNSMTWYDLTLINGNKVGGRKPQYAVWGNQVFTRGEVVSPDFNSVFAILPAEARPSTQKSMAATLFGTTGTSKYIAETNGELRLVGKHANIEANITGVSLDNNFTL
ncbi:hypothetical protein G4P54_06715 [Bacillus tequilensis]|uniref:Phage tail protein n=1 Tax=Bacillus tequilensis TaxID=227866 RepID=A0A6H0WG21_9BACI|nr:hypothetical protein G4P54_06715 [Bacillus tequilensis]